MEPWRQQRLSNVAYYGDSSRRRSGNRARFLIFLSVFVLGCAVGLSYTYSRPAIYETSASLLITPPTDAPSATSAQVDPQTVGFERHALMANSLLSELNDRIQTESGHQDGTPATLADLQHMLRVERFEETNIVKLWVRASAPAILPIVANLWVNVYVESQVKFQQSLFDETDAELEQQTQDLQGRVEEKRAELANFRFENDIVSMQRDENRVLSEFNGLTNALNIAREEEVNARAYLEAVRSAVSKNQPVGTREDQARIGALENERLQLQYRVREFEDTYTADFIPYDREIQRVIEQLEIVEETLSEARKQAQSRVIADAEQRLATAQQSAREFGREVGRREQDVATFTSIFAVHVALQAELEQLEAAYREVVDRQVRRQVDRQRVITKVQILESAFEPLEPIWPDYTRDAAISVGGSLLIAFLSVLFYDFFNRPERLPAAPQDERVLYELARDALLVSAAAPKLEHDQPRELSESETQAEEAEAEVLEGEDQGTLPAPNGNSAAEDK